MIKTFQTLDLYLSAFLSLQGISPNLKINGNKVVFFFDASDQLYKLLADFNSNISIPVTDFCTAIKILRGQMITMRGQR